MRFIGESSAAQEVRRQIDVIAGSDLNVLLRGETGVGKEVAARLIHGRSRRSNGPFVIVNCPAITETLAEDELFGHERGAFTGAIGPRTGLLEEANHGTVFFDEVGDMQPQLQLKLLRYLSSESPSCREIRRVAGKNAQVDTRVIAATNQNINATDKFRCDLFHRLNTFPIYVPPLRERREDIPLLARHFSGEMDVTPDTLQLLTCYSWPGNVRELKNAIDRAGVLARYESRSEIQPSDIALPDSIARLSENSPRMLTYGEAMREASRTYLKYALDKCGGNKTAAARMIGVSRPNLTRLLKRHGLCETTS
jgi:transcriptional regulator with GAF, ATPase, and Fis domain